KHRIACEEGRREGLCFACAVNRKESCCAVAKKAALCDGRHGEMGLLPRLDVLLFKRSEEKGLVANDRETHRGPPLIALERIFALRGVRRHDLLTINLDG